MTSTIYLVSAISLGACIVFAVSNHVQHIALDHMNVRDGTIVNVGTTCLLLWLMAPFFLIPETLLTPDAAWFALAGLIVPSLSMTLHTYSVRLIGPGLTAGLTSTSPVFAMAIAVVILGELVTGQILLGTALVAGGIAITTLRSRGGPSTWPIWAVAVPLGAALSRALSHNFVKVGLDDLRSPMTAALVGATVSLVIIVAINLASGHRMAKQRGGFFWFGLCGILNAIGLIGLKTALELGSVVVASPLIAATPAFTILIGWMFFRRERVGWTTLAALAVIMAGCVLIILR